MAKKLVDLFDACQTTRDEVALAELTAVGIAVVHTEPRDDVRGPIVSSVAGQLGDMIIERSYAGWRVPMLQSNVAHAILDAMTLTDQRMEGCVTKVAMDRVADDTTILTDGGLAALAKVCAANPTEGG
ncbi:MAG: hypothetical protein PHT12_02510 [Patescibacteria group bacterium]|nr:hypothetical protein [Patescibacteria group bacterium]